MALGSVKHSRGKVRRHVNSTGAQLGRGVSIRVTTGRSTVKRGEFWARACVARPGPDRVSMKQCGAKMFGNSPTSATKKALHKLATQLK